LSLLFLSLLFLIETESVIPDLEALLYAQEWQAFEPLLSKEQKVRVNLKPLLNEKGKMSSSQTLFSFRKLFQRYEMIKISQGDFRSDTNYSQIEISVHFEIKNRLTEKTTFGAFLFILNFRNGKPRLTRWAVTDFYT